ncbi:MAG: hypothetical protein HKN25_00035 [Pyrinomonadaceae bacterium]|nr:hypothetical protein [Pyrinomonadaceae bacterium]
MLANRVQVIPAIMLDTPHGKQQLQIQCHQATGYWLYEEAFNEAPTGDHYTNSSLFEATEMMTNLARYGKKLSPPAMGSLNIASGTVLIFTDQQNTAKHSCVINGAGNIGGYNQQSWFSSTGIANSFTTHATGDIRWRNRLRKHKVKLNSQNSKGNLVAVESARAVSFFKHNFVYRFE